MGGPPCIVKLHQGTQGIGTMIADTPQAATSLLETLWAMGQDIILQQYIAEAKGRDLRAIVVGGRVVAAMRRQAKAGEFRSNLHRGGLGVRAQLDPRYRRVAIAATRVMGLEVAGVDMLETREGPKILEINSSPGLEGIERASGVDVAGAIIAHAEKWVAARKHRKRSPLDEERRLSRIRDGGPPVVDPLGRSPQRRGLRCPDHGARARPHRAPGRGGRLDARPTGGQERARLEHVPRARARSRCKRRQGGTPGCALIVLTGAGDSFVSGGDLRELRTRTTSEDRRAARRTWAGTSATPSRASRCAVIASCCPGRPWAAGRSSPWRATCASPTRAPRSASSTPGWA